MHPALGPLVAGLLTYAAPGTPPSPVPQAEPVPAPAVLELHEDRGMEPDLEIRAVVRIRELTVVTAPQGAAVRFPGEPDRHTVWETRETGVPEKLREGETYHDVVVELTISSRFEDLLALLNGSASDTTDRVPVPAAVSGQGSLGAGADEDAQGATPYRRDPEHEPAGREDEP